MRILKESDYGHLRKHYRRNVMWAVSILLLAVLVAALVTAYSPLLAFIVAMPFLGGVARFWTIAENYRAGITGEMAVMRTLQGLDDSYGVIQDVMVGETGGNIDHVLVSPKGVLVIEAKNYTGVVKCYGDRWYRRGAGRSYETRSISGQAKMNARELGGLIRRETGLRAWVEPVCVFTGRRVRLQLHDPTVTVLRLPELPNFVRQARGSYYLSNSDMQRITGCILARDSAARLTQT